MKHKASSDVHPHHPRRLVPGVHTIIPSKNSQTSGSGSWWLALDRNAFAARAEKEAERLRRRPYGAAGPTPTR